MATNRVRIIPTGGRVSILESTPLVSPLMLEFRRTKTQRKNCLRRFIPSLVKSANCWHKKHRNTTF